MEKFSVKKPFTVLVAVIMVIMLGLVSVQNMQTNLLPNVNTPYLMVVTVYPGASPERVENEVSDVMESALGTISGVKNVTATSAENYSLLLMEFEDDTDMNSAVVKVSNKVDQTTSSLPSTCMTPSIIEYTLNMNAFMTVAVSREGSDSYELADFVNDTMVPYIERQGGVSNISANGLVTRMVQVQLDQEKIDAINEKLLEVIDVQLADAKAQLDSAEAQIEAGRKQYETQLANYDKLVSDTINSQYSGELQDSFMLVKKQAQALLDSVNQLIAVVNEPEIQQALIDVRDGLQRVVDKFNETGMQDIDSLIEIVAELRDITDKLTTALQELQQRLNAQGDTAGTTAGELADDLQVQQSLNNIYSTLESTIKAMDDVPGLMDQFTQIVGSYSQQQLQAYIKFTEAREMLNDYEKQLEDAKQQYEDAYGTELPGDIQDALDKLLSKENLKKLQSVLTCMSYLRNAERGFDMYVTEDGVNFTTLTTNGFNDPYNHGLRTFAVTNQGLCLGTANPFYGCQVWIQRKENSENPIDPGTPDPTKPTDPSQPGGGNQPGGSQTGGNDQSSSTATTVSTTTKKTPKDGSLPHAGDSTLTLVLGLLVAAAAVLGIALVLRKRSRC